MACNSCAAPASTTNVYNTSVAASQFAVEGMLVTVPNTVTCTDLPADGGFFLLFLDHVAQTYGVDYSVDFDTGIVTLTAAAVGQWIDLVYIKA